MGTLKTTNIQSISGSGTVTLGTSGETFTVPSGVTVNMSSATQTGVGGVNTPAFRATMGSDQNLTDNVAGKIEFDTETYDIGSCYDPSTNYRFTVPSGEGGYYLINAQIQLKSDDDGQHVESFIKLYKNGSATYFSYDNFSGTGNTNGNMLYNTQIVNLSAGDYIEVYGQINVTTATPVAKGGYSYFQACKLIT